MLWYHIHFLQNAIGTAYFPTFNMRVVRLPYALSLFDLKEAIDLPVPSLFINIFPKR